MCCAHSPAAAAGIGNDQKKRQDDHLWQSSQKQPDDQPIGLAKGAELKCDVKKDEIITYDMVEMSNDSVLLQLRRIQDLMYK